VYTCPGFVRVGRSLLPNAIITSIVAWRRWVSYEAEYRHWFTRADRSGPKKLDVRKEQLAHAATFEDPDG